MTHYDQSQEHEEILSESWEAGGHGPTQLPSTIQNEAGSVITKGVIHDLAATTVWDSWREKRINAEFFHEYLRNSQCTCAGWSYDMRRVAQEIIPEKLWLGPLAAARKYSALMSCGITHVLSYLSLSPRLLTSLSDCAGAFSIGENRAPNVRKSRMHGGSTSINVHQLTCCHLTYHCISMSVFITLSSSHKSIYSRPR